MHDNIRKIVAVSLCIFISIAMAGCGNQTAAKTEEALENTGKILDKTEETVGKTEQTVDKTEKPADKTEILVGEMAKEKYSDASIIELRPDAVTIDGETVEMFDYTWHCDPSTVHDEVKNAPAEYYTGTKPSTDAAVYIDHELYYYPLLDENKFTSINYDGEKEWAYYYQDGVHDEYIFATLPNLGQQLPKQMMHSESEAAENMVLHITKPGTYVLRGDWNGQVNVDCGEGAYENEEAKVIIILDNVNIRCSVAPGLIFNNVYEVDNNWKNYERTDATVDTTGAGATVIIADDSQNYISGQNIFRMLKTQYKNEDSTEQIKTQKKMRKTDGVLYSCMTMNITGEEKGNGILTVESSFEGIDSELHLNIQGGNITVNSQDDGMNVNEDNVSVIAFTGGNVTLNAALGAEGDGVDSNGYIWVNGGTISVNGIRVPDSALDSEDGIYYQSGKVVIDGEEQNYEPNSVFKETRDGSFGPRNGGGPGNGDFGPRDDEFGPKPRELENGNSPGEPGMRENEMPMPDDRRKEDWAWPGREMLSPENFDIKQFKEKVSKLSDDATLEDVLSLLRNP